MPTVRRPTIDDGESVVLWRTARLRDAGFEPELAATLARDCTYDLHGLLRLVDQGCSPELAVRILAPLDRQARPC